MGERLDVRALGAAIGNLTGQPELADEVLSGNLSAEDTVPLAAGMIEGVLRSMLQPLIQAQSVNGPWRAKKGPSVKYIVLTKGGERMYVHIGVEDA